MGFGVLLQWKFFLVWRMRTLDVVLEEGRFLVIIWTIMLVHVAKYPFFMSWTKVCWMGLKRVELYHFPGSSFVIYARELSAELIVCMVWCSGFLVRFIWQIPDAPVIWTSIAVWYWLYTVRLVEVKAMCINNNRVYLWSMRISHIRVRETHDLFSSTSSGIYNKEKREQVKIIIFE